MRKFLKILILTFLGAVTITSCSDDSDGIPGWPWNDNSTEKPDEPDVAEAKPRYIWIDAAANFPDYANSKENIGKDMEKIKAAGFTDIIVDVRPTTGDVLFNTNVVIPDIVIMKGRKLGIIYRHLLRRLVYKD